MKKFTYVIIGGGMTADAAVQGIREVDTKGSIGIVTSEPDPPYFRPPLSKGLWKGEPMEKIWCGTKKHGAEINLGLTIRSIAPNTKRVMDDTGAEYTFDKLLLATGGTPRRLPFGGDQAIYFRTLGDYKRLRALTEQKETFAVIGGGFIGSEIAAALAMNKKKVVMVFPEEGIGRRVFPRAMALFLNVYYREKNVEVLPGESVVGIESGNGLEIRLQNITTKKERRIMVDAVVAGIGIQPNIELAQQAGLEVGNGIVVDEHLCTSNPDIYAAGDVALFRNPLLGQIRMEHDDNAVTMGKHAGRAMAGSGEPYRHIPFFYSDLFDMGYEAVGEIDSRLETAEDWRTPYKEGVIYYLQDKRVRGALMVNVWGKVDAARKLMAEPGPFRPGDLTGRIK